MNYRPLLIHVGLVCAALIASYFVWTREPSGSEDEVTVLALRGGVERVVYSANDRTVEVDRRKDQNGTYYSVRVETMENPPPPPPRPATEKDKGGNTNTGTKPDPSKTAGSKSEPTKVESAKAEKNGVPKAEPSLVKGAKGMAAATPPLAKVRKVQEFTGNKGAEGLMNNLSSLSAIRSLGTLEPDKLKAFGLTDSKKTLTLVTSSTPRVITIGGTTYGNMDHYIQVKEDGRVYVIRPQILQDLLYAEHRLQERNLHTFALSDVDRVEITAQGSKKILVQQNRRDPGAAYWADEMSPSKRKDFYRNWISKLMRLQAMEYVKPDKKIVGLSTLVTVEYFSGRKKVGALQVFKQIALLPKVGGPSDNNKVAGSPKEDAGDEYYARSEATRTQVKIARPVGEEIARDIPSLMKE